MFKRGFAIVMGFALLFVFAAQPARADDPPGAKLYATYCVACHGAAGKGGFAPALGTETYLGKHDDAAIAQTTREGVAGKGMPPWSKAQGGSLTDDQIDNIVAYLRAFASGAAAPAPGVAVPATSSTEQASLVPPVVYAQTRLALTQSPNAGGETESSRGMVLVATLTKFDGTPVSGLVIAFTRATMFGIVDVGTAKTDNQGRASLVVREQPESARQITATFKGEKTLGSSAAMIALGQPVVAMSSGNVNINNVRLSIGDEPLLAPEGSLITPNPPLVPTALFALVVGCVWAMYGFVLNQVYGIWKNGRVADRNNTFTRKTR